MLDEKGFSRPTYNEIIKQTEQIAKDVFGEDIDTSEQTPFGKFIRIISYVHADIYKDLENTYYASFPNTASGVNLDKLCPFAGITRNPATYAEHKIKVYGTQDAEIEEIKVCGDDNEIVFHNVMPFVIDTATEAEEPEYYAIVEVQCEISGKEGNVLDIHTLVEQIAEISRIEYVGLKELGEDVESDFALRKRFSEAIEGGGSCNANSIRAALIRIPNIVSVAVISNNTDEVDDKGRPPHSVECFVYGGEDKSKEIAEAIFSKLPIGISTYSTSKKPVVVTVTDVGGHPHDITYSHTEDIPVYISIKYKKNNTFERDGEAQIRLIIADYISGLGVGGDVVLSALYGYIYSVSGITDVTEIKLSTNGTEYKAENIVVGDYQVAQITTDNITLTEVEE